MTLIQSSLVQGEIYESPYVDFNTIKREPETLYVISYGGGVNSTAMAINILESGAPVDAIIFSDTGAEMPETLEYIKIFNEHIKKYFRKEILTVYPKRGTIIEIAESQNIIPRPASARRWCTAEVKIKPVRQRCRKIMRAEKKRKLVLYVGIDAQESHRVKPPEVAYIKHSYPLIDSDFSRRMCVELIEKYNLPIPVKSGCYFCEFQPKSKWRELYFKHPELYARAAKMEANAFNRKTKEPEYFNYLHGKPISLIKLAESYKTQMVLELDQPENMGLCDGGCMD